MRSLTAIALDTETTSLDTRRARVLEIGAVALGHGRLVPDMHFAALVNPHEEIPPDSTAVHGITSDALRDAQKFAPVYKRFCDFAGAHVILGFALGFDFAVLRREHERAGLAWKAPRFLDVRDLAELLRPNLPDLGLETLASWLGVTFTERHRALPDATLAAEVFLTLVPRLRAISIRTLAEAEDACRGLGGNTRKPDWYEAPMAPAAPMRVDAYPYRHRAMDVMSKPPQFAAPSMNVRKALGLLVSSKVSSLFIDLGIPGTSYGIVTERDILRAIASDGVKAFEKPVKGIATFPLECVAESDFLYVAFGRMRRKRYRHMGVVDDTGKLVGAITQRDLLRLQADEALAFADALEEAASISELALVWRKLANAASSLLHEDVDARDIAAIISREVQTLTARAAEIAEREMAGSSPKPEGLHFAIMVLGSGGRGESLLALDQDNAIIYTAKDEPKAEVWLLKFGQRINAILDEIGVPYCKGGVMTGNRAWCKSEGQWRRQVAHWLSRSEPPDILNADIFFDALPVYGDHAIANRLRADAIAAASKSTPFLQLMALNAATTQSPLTWLGRFRLEDDGRIDLKKHAIMPVFSAARVMALRHEVLDHSTAGRLERLRGRPEMSDESLDSLLEAHQIIMRFILQQQLVDIERGKPLSNRVDPKILHFPERARLKWALEQVPLVANLLGDPVG